MASSIVERMERAGCRPVEVEEGIWLAICPCCGNLDAVLVLEGKPPQPTETELEIWRDRWLEAQAGRF